MARIIITGGGTGGHIFPALAVADELVRRGTLRADVLFVGSRRGMERDIVARAGYRFIGLPGRGFARQLSVQNVRTSFDTFRAFARALRLIKSEVPRVVLGTGGFASFPIVFAARIRRIPTVVHEQNAAPGVVNRIATHLGAHSAVSLPNTALRNAIFTGNPVRREVYATERKPQKPPLIVFSGGSLGARRINDAALGCYEIWRNRTDLAVIHVCGKRNLVKCETLLESRKHSSDQLSYELTPFVEDIADVYRRATLFVCRAGAVTVAELAATGMPAIFVPLPGAPGDHQTANANRIVDAGGALLIADSQADASAISGQIEELLQDASRLDRMHKAQLSLAMPDASARVADLVETYL